MKWGVSAMTSITSFFSWGIFKDNIRRFSWIGILYTIALFFAVPLHILMTYGNKDANYRAMKDFFYLKNGDMQSVLVLVVAILVGMAVFRYLQVKTLSDMMHSLPIKRKVLYRTNILTSLLLLILPVLFTALTSWIINGALGLGLYYGLQDIVEWAKFIIVMELVIFFVTVAVGMMVGISVVQGVLTCIFLFLPLGLAVLLSDFLGTMLYGFVWNLATEDVKLSPIVRLAEGFNDWKFSSGEIITYLIICLGLYFLSQWLYQKRKLETVSQTIVFHHFKWIFKYGVTFCTMLLAGFYFNSTQHNFSWVLFGYFIGSLIGYLIAEMVIKKTFFVFKNIKGYVIYTIVMLVVSLGLQFDLVGYERQLPPSNEIRSISFGDSFYAIKDGKRIYADKENIANLYRLHEQIINNKAENKYRDKHYSNQILFVYHLKDGSELTRGYSIDYDNYAQYFKPIYESKEYKRINYNAYKVDAADVEKMTIRPSLQTGNNKQTVILQPDEIREAINILKQDIDAENYETMIDNETSWAIISLLISDNKVKEYQKAGLVHDSRNVLNGLSWQKSYVNFEAWLKKKGYWKNARVMPEDISYVVVEKLDNPRQLDEKRETGEWIDNNGAKQIKITDKDQIEACLRNYSGVWSEKNVQYVIGFYTNGDVEYGSFSKDNIPSFIKNRL